ncbi:hypothetical protein TWF718_000147 [Orbilia javanica]|uniref:Uncharacterized protein n=1 Tax=Orbilia javanica TaxID=47235 RepID=A0AAN8P0S2_9PEZI
MKISFVLASAVLLATAQAAPAQAAPAPKARGVDSPRPWTRPGLDCNKVTPKDPSKASQPECKLVCGYAQAELTDDGWKGFDELCNTPLWYDIKQAVKDLKGRAAPQPIKAIGPTRPSLNCAKVAPRFGNSEEAAKKCEAICGLAQEDGDWKKFDGTCLSDYDPRTRPGLDCWKVTARVQENELSDRVCAMGCQYAQDGLTEDGWQAVKDVKEKFNKTP